nr:hypothetical protein [Tanacetum cinerariifolium]
MVTVRIPLSSFSSYLIIHPRRCLSEIFFSSGISLPQQEELFFIAVGMNSGSGNSSLAVEMSLSFYSQQSSPKLDALSAIKFPEYNALPGEDAFNHFSVLDCWQSCESSVLSH